MPADDILYGAAETDGPRVPLRRVVARWAIFATSRLYRTERSHWRPRQIQVAEGSALVCPPGESTAWNQRMDRRSAQRVASNGTVSEPRAKEAEIECVAAKGSSIVAACYSPTPLRSFKTRQPIA